MLFNCDCNTNVKDFNKLVRSLSAKLERKLTINLKLLINKLTQMLLCPLPDAVTISNIKAKFIFKV